MTLFGIDWSEYYSILGEGLLKTVEFTAVSFAGAALLGGFLAICRVQKIAPLRWFAAAYVELFKNVPLLTWLFLIYFGLPSVDILLPSFVAGSLALILFYGAYLGEIFRGGLQGVEVGQSEAAQAMGLTSRQLYWYVILPQALRQSLAGTGTMLVDLLKATSLLVTIAAGELLTQAQVITSVTFKALEVYAVIGLLYFALCYPTSQAVLWFERRLRSGTPVSLRRRRTRAYARVLQPTPTGGAS
jgi:polar amino acid transport system permease protein